MIKVLGKPGQVARQATGPGFDKRVITAGPVMSTRRKGEI